MVDDIWTSPAQPIEGESVQVYARIKNDGYQPAFNVGVNFYERHPGSDFNSIGYDSVVMIDGGQQATVSVNVSNGFLYQTIVKAVVDEGFPAGFIPELHEKNNRRTEKVHIRMPDPALAAGELPIDPYFPFTDSNVSIKPEITNLGCSYIWIILKSAIQGKGKIGISNYCCFYVVSISGKCVTGNMVWVGCPKASDTYYTTAPKG